MTILFCGGELDDFSLTGLITAGTNALRYRSAYSRMTVDVNGSAGTTTTLNIYAKASFTASAAFSVTARFYMNTQFSANAILCQFGSSTNTRLRLRTSSSTNPTTIYLEKYDGTTATTLATSTATLSVGTLYRLDIIVDYQTSGRVRVFIDGTGYIDYSGDPTVTGGTTLDSFHLGSNVTNTTMCWSEVIVSTQDSRTLSLVTLAPNAAGTTSSWTGAYTDIDETTASDVDVLTSATAMQITSVNCTGMPSGWSNLTVTAVKVIVSAARGSTGPSKLALGVRTNSTDSFPTAVTLDTGFSTPVTTYYELNPVTGVAWTTTEIDALQIALRSET